MGSVKDLKIIQKPTETASGTGNFVFSDRYSVFDWGEMPDHIQNKGKALCMIGAHFFEQVEQMGMKTHYLGLVENGSTLQLSDISAPVNTMQVRLVQVVKPNKEGGVYDYSAYERGIVNALVPLEIIYRNSLPEGSSVFKRLNVGVLRPQDIGLSEIPAPGQDLPQPILDASTKLETTDRYLSWQEAKKISGLTPEQLDSLKETTLKIDALITRETEKMQLVHEDGKLEYGLDKDGQLMIVDVFGTPDECRFTFEDLPVSKEVARKFYRKTDWYKDVEQAKRQNRLEWKALVGSPPPPLPERFSQLIAQIYMAFCNQLTEREWFDVPTLQEIMYEIREFIE